MIEEWKDTEYTGYQVSNLGRVKNKYEKILKPIIRHGYYDVGLYINHKNKKIKIHRLVAKAFIPNSNNYPIVNHIDENKLNNRADTLECCNNKYNCNYGNRNKKISKKVLQFNINNEFIKEYESLTEASKKCNISVSNITRSCNTHYKAGGYIWKYA